MQRDRLDAEHAYICVSRYQSTYVGHNLISHVDSVRKVDEDRRTPLACEIFAFRDPSDAGMLLM